MEYNHRFFFQSPTVFRHAGIDVGKFQPLAQTLQIQDRKHSLAVNTITMIKSRACQQPAVRPVLRQEY